MTSIVGVIAPRESSAEWQIKLPPVVDRMTDELVRYALVKLFRCPLPNPN